MSGDLFGSCINGNPCPKTCLPIGWKDPTYNQFGQTIPSFVSDTTTITPTPINPTNSQRTVYGGLLNSRRIKQYASMHILAKGSLATVDTTPGKTTVGKLIQVGTSDTTHPSYTNVGGPGDQIKSVPLGITGFVRGNKARVYSMPGKHDGVDVKHNSYNRYLLRKKGIALRCSNC